MTTRFSSTVASKILPVYLLLIICVFTFSHASVKVNPTFNDYAVAEVFKGKPSPVNLGSHPRAAVFRTQLRTAADEGANFAGHYTIAMWGCGTGCSNFAFVDLISGKVFFPPMQAHFPSLPNEPITMERYGIDFRLNSRLLIINGLPGDEEKVGTYYYELVEGNLIKINSQHWDTQWNEK